MSLLSMRMKVVLVSDTNTNACAITGRQKTVCRAKLASQLRGLDAVMALFLLPFNSVRWRCSLLKLGQQMPIVYVFENNFNGEWSHGLFLQKMKWKLDNIEVEDIPFNYWQFVVCNFNLKLFLEFKIKVYIGK